MTKRFLAGCIGFAVSMLAATAHALVEDTPGGMWPKVWPASLEPLRVHAHTIGIANGTQENIYEIAFTDRTEFEKAWPSLLSLKTPGAPLRLYRVGPKPPNQFVSNATSTVRIIGPAGGHSIGPNGHHLEDGPPWPKELYTADGELPEYVVRESKNGTLHLVAAPAKDDAPRFHFRARVDLELVTDGQIIDLNRIRLPDRTPIQDLRF